jgi:pimeloyl-ACP methyl ester carboxylesterase
MTLLLIVIAILLSFALAGMLFQAIASARDARRFPPPGHLIDVGGHRLHIHCIGKGEPTVVFDSGLPGSSLSWCYVQPEVAKFARACSYDRAGLGWSEPGPTPRNSLRIVEELHALLVNAGVPPPYVLVGHSFGGFTVRLYASRYPHEVVGLVLVDPLHPEEWESMARNERQQIEAGVRLARRVALFARFGLMRLYFYLVRVHVVKPRVRSAWIASIEKMPGNLLPVLRASWCRPEPYETIMCQVKSLSQSAAQVAATSGFGDLPLRVLSASNPNEDRQLAQDAAAGLSANGRHTIASDSGHWINIDQPALVVEAIREVVDLARQRRVTGSEQSVPSR